MFIPETNPRLLDPTVESIKWLLKHQSFSSLMSLPGDINRQVFSLGWGKCVCSSDQHTVHSCVILCVWLLADGISAFPIAINWMCAVHTLLKAGLFCQAEVRGSLPWDSLFLGNAHRIFSFPFWGIQGKYHPGEIAKDFLTSAKETGAHILDLI